MVDPIYCISISSPKRSFNVVKTCWNNHKSPVWEWFIAPIKMVMTGGWFIQNIQRIGVDISNSQKTETRHGLTLPMGSILVACLIGNHHPKQTLPLGMCSWRSNWSTAPALLPAQDSSIFIIFNHIPAFFKYLFLAKSILEHAKNIWKTSLNIGNSSNPDLLGHGDPNWVTAISPTIPLWCHPPLRTLHSRENLRRWHVGLCPETAKDDTAGGRCWWLPYPISRSSADVVLIRTLKPESVQRIFGLWTAKTWENGSKPVEISYGYFEHVAAILVFYIFYRGPWRQHRQLETDRTTTRKDHLLIGLEDLAVALKMMNETYLPLSTPQEKNVSEPTGKHQQAVCAVWCTIRTTIIIWVCLKIGYIPNEIAI